MRPPDHARIDARFAPATRLLWADGVIGALERIARAGFGAAEVWAQHLWEAEQSPHAAGRRARELGLRLSLHAPSYDLNPLSSNPEVRDVSRRQVLASLETAEQLGAGIVAVHPGALSSTTDDPEEYWGRLDDYALALDRRAGSHGLRIGLEGMERKRLQFVTDLTAMRRLAGRLDALGLSRVGLTLDIAHAATLGDPLEYARETPRVFHAHLSDTSPGKTHALLGEGLLDLRALVPALLARVGNGLVAIEGRFASDEPRALDVAARVLSGLPELA